MSSTLVVDAVEAWLVNALSRSEVLAAWLYGSFTTRSANVGDVDVLVRYRTGWSVDAAKCRRRIEAQFYGEFSIPLHAIFLSEGEFEDESNFIEALLVSSRELQLGDHQVQQERGDA
jgi:predicted nucleotidyltransferase